VYMRYVVLLGVLCCLESCCKSTG